MHSVGTLSRVPEYSENRKHCIDDGARCRERTAVSRASSLRSSPPTTLDPPPARRGNYRRAPLWAGESCGLVHDIKPAAEIVRDLVREAQAAMSALNATP